MSGKKLINTVLQVGTLESVGELTNFKVVLTNSIAILSSIVNYFYVVIFLCKLQFPYSGFYFAGGSISLLCVYLNHQQQQKTASWILLSVIGIIIISTSMISGFTTQCHTILVVVSACAVLISTSLYYSIVYVAALLILYCLCYSYVDMYGPLFPESKLTYSEFINFGFALICAFVFAVVLLKKVVDYIETLKETLEQLKNKNDEIQDKNSKLELFNAIAAHDLRTPIRNISSFTGLAKRKIDIPSEKWKVNGYLDTVENSAKQMNDLINSIADMNKLNKDKLFDLEHVELNTLIQQITNQIIKPAYPNVKIKSDELPVLTGNRAHLHTVFQNLFQNALKYNLQNQKEIHISAISNDRGVSILVTDNGIGIDVKYISKIFDPFAKLHSETQFQGTGMGLYIVREILDRYDASICVKESSETGTTFQISFPKTMISRSIAGQSQSHDKQPIVI